MRLALRTTMNRPASSSRKFFRTAARSGTLPEQRWLGVEDLSHPRTNALHDLVILLQQGTETRTGAVHGFHRSFLHDEVCVLARHSALDEGQQDPLRKDDPAGELQVREHAPGPHLEPA